jgi:hypothetical protein
MPYSANNLRQNLNKALCYLPHSGSLSSCSFTRCSSISAINLKAVLVELKALLLNTHAAFLAYSVVRSLCSRQEVRSQRLVSRRTRSGLATSEDPERLAYAATHGLRIRGLGRRGSAAARMVEPRLFVLINLMFLEV